MKIKTKRSVTLLVIIVCGFLSVVAQNLTASQMYIYFGQPKKVTVQNDQGTEVTEFDRDGRIVSTSQRNMRIVYDWAEDGSEVKLTVFQGKDIEDSGAIKVFELSKKRYSYNVDGIVDMNVDFMDNGAIYSSVMTTPKMNLTTKYFYKESEDMFPDAIEYSYSKVNRSNKVSFTIDRFDSLGNPLEFTQVVKGSKNVIRQTIEYY